MTEREKISIRTFILMTVLIVSGLFIYSNTLYSPFIFDDENYIVDNYELRDLSKFLKNFYGTRYVGLLSFAVNYYFNGLDTFGYHLVNIAIHILNAMLVYVLVSLTLQRVQGFKGSRVQESFSTPLDPLTPRILPFAVSLLFLVHPIQTQAVTYISQRVTSLAAFFYLLAIVLYVKARLVRCENCENRFTFYILLFTSYLSTILAMKTKEISFTLPFIIALYEFTFFKNNDSRPTTLNSRLVYLIPYLLTLAIIPLEFLFEGEGLDQGLKQAQLADIKELSKYDYLLTQFNVVVTYIRLLFLPINQNFDYDYPIAHSIFEPRTFLSFLFLLSIFGFAVYLYIRSRKTHNIHGILTSFGIFWFFITLSVESSIIPIRDVIFEHRLYLPSIGAIIAFNTGLLHGIEYARARLLQAFQSLPSAITFFLFMILVFAFIFSAAAVKRNFIWQDPIVMSLDVLKKSPNKAEVRSNIGVLYFGKGLFDKAKDEFEKAIQLKPDMFIAYNNMGLIYQKEGFFDKAEKAFKKAVEIRPDYHKAYENLGTMYMEMGMFDDALRELKNALKIKYSPILYNKLGVVYLKLGDKGAAIRAFKEAIRLEPDFLTPYVNMGFAYFDKGLLEDAEMSFRKALGIMPGFANAHYGLAEVYEKRGIKDKAAEHYREYIKYANPAEPFVERAKKKIAELGAE